MLVLALIVGCFAVLSQTVRATPLDDLKGQVPNTATEFIAVGISNNGLNKPNTLWWDYDLVAKTGDVYLLVQSDNSGKIAVTAKLGSADGEILGSVDKKTTGSIAYTLIKFTGVWLNGDETIFVDMAAGGQNINGKVSDYFPQLRTIRYYDDETFLGSDTQPSGTTVFVWDIDELPGGVPTGYKFLGWAYVNHAERPSVAVRSPLVLDDEDIDLYAVWAKDDEQTRDVTYTVKYTRDGFEVVADTYTVTVPVWINEPDDVAVPVAAISAANNRYVGYKLASDPFVAPATAQNGDVITVPYVKDDSQTRDVTYTVKYTIGSDEVVADTYTVTTKVWILAPADVAVDVDDIDATNDRYEGCKLLTDPFVAPPTAQHGDVITVPYVKIPYTITFLPGTHGDFEAQTGTFYIGDVMPDPPHPYADFSYKFLGWRDDKGIFYAAPDYRKPNEIIGFPEFVTGNAIFTAEWAEIDPSMTFPDKIPSEQHFDRWWGDYGIICFAASTTKDNDYTIIFADWFFEAFKTCTIGFGAPDKMDYEIRFTEDGTTLWQKTGITLGNQLQTKVTYLTSMT